MTAFDHSAVVIYRRDHEAAVEAALAEWGSSRNNGDERHLIEGAEAIRAGRTEEAKEHLRLFTRRHPDVVVGQLEMWKVSDSARSRRRPPGLSG